MTATTSGAEGQAVAYDIDARRAQATRVAHAADAWSPQGRPIVVVSGDTTGSIDQADVVRSWDGIGRPLVVERLPTADTELDGGVDGDADRGADLEAALGADLEDVTVVLQTQGAIRGIEWARLHPERIRALVLIDPIIRPHSKRELLASGVGRDEQDTVRQNAAWLSTSHVPKILFATRDAVAASASAVTSPSSSALASSARSASATQEWAAAHVRNLTIETLDLASGSRDDLGRSIRGWLGHISW